MASSTVITMLVVFGIVGNSNSNPLIDNCDDKVICLNKPENYRSFQNDIDAIVQKNKGMFSNGFQQWDDYESTTSGDDENCKAVTRMEKPFMIKGNESREYVVQSKHFEQRVRITRCQSLKSSCFKRVKTPGFNFMESTCEEKLGSVSLYVYDPEVNEIRYKMFEIPVCCTCKMRSLYKK